MTGGPPQLLRGALVVDGTGSPARRADVLVADGRIASVAEPGAIRPSGGDTVDLDGLVLAPGFVDVHTHYDAQVLWDPDLTPSSWHGVTTVVMGNCGVGLAPTRSRDREAITASLVSVEGMAEEALRSGIDWCFETFPEYLAALRARRPRLNVELLLAHSPLRAYVMGDAAFEREATRAEVDAMVELTAEAVGAGALGIGTSRSPNHQVGDGRPVPSRLAAVDELVRLARAAAEVRPGAVLEIAAGPDLTPDDLASLARASGATVTWTTVLAGRRVRGRTSAELLDDIAALGAPVWTQVTCLPVRVQFTLMDPPSILSRNPTFAEILAAPRPARGARYADEAWLARAEAELADEWAPMWDRTRLVVEGGDGTEDLGPSATELAAAGGTTPLRAVVAAGLRADLRARFDLVVGNDDEAELGDLLRDGRTLLGLSDAGAHADQLCDARYATHLLAHWWRETGTLSLEQAVWRLTGQPAEVFGLADRGRTIAGTRADLVAFDPASVGASPLRRVRDLPTGAERLVSSGVGVEHVWVGGVAIRRDGRDDPAARPGTVARASVPTSEPG